MPLWGLSYAILSLKGLGKVLSHEGVLSKQGELNKGKTKLCTPASLLQLDKAVGPSLSNRLGVQVTLSGQSISDLEPFSLSLQLTLCPDRDPGSHD